MPPKPPDHLNLTVAELDLLLGDVANRRAPILPILRRVRSGDCGYLEITYARSRILRLGPPGSLPMVALLADGEGRGPDGFPQAGFLRHLLSRAGAVLLTCDDDPLAFELAASHAGDARRHCVIIECPRQAIEPWAELAHECGIGPDNLVCMLREPSLPDGLLDQVAVGDIPPAAPKRSLN